MQTERNTYSSDKEVSQNSAKIKLKFCNDNVISLLSVDRKKKKFNALLSFLEMVRNNESFTKNQLGYIDGIYEATMKGLNLPSIGLHIDKKRKGIRY